MGFDRDHNDLLAETLTAAVNAAQSSPDPEAQIAAWSQVLEIEPKLDPWPLEQADRHHMKGAALASRAAVYSDRIRGDRAENLEAAIAGYDAALEVFTREADPVGWAKTQMGRAIAYSVRIHGDRADNLETAIVGYDAALEIRIREAMPVHWAQTQLIRAAVYSDRIRGDRADNLETAIAGYDAVLEVFTREAMPDHWEQTQMGRADAYSDRIHGDRADNLEAAIAGYDAALEIRARKAMPVDGTTQKRRADAYAELSGNILVTSIGHSHDTPNRTYGDRAKNLEAAIAGYDAALEVCIREAMPNHWAKIQLNRAAAYSDRIRGDHTDNLEVAIAGYDAALEVFTRDTTPVEWAAAQMNRAATYTIRSRGNKADNLEIAIAGYDAALEIRTRETKPVDWATTQMNRATAYSNRIRGDRADNLETAIAGYDAALEIRTREAMLIDWATTQMNRAAMYSDRIRGDQADNLEIAIAVCDAVLEVFTRETNPVNWATTQVNRATAYSNRIRGDRADNLEAAIVGYDAALGVFRAEVLPKQHLRTSSLLGATRLTVGDWDGAAKALYAARSTADLLIGQGLNETETAHVLEEASAIGPHAAFAIAKGGDAFGALEALEAGRAHQLTIALHQNTARDALDTVDSARLDALRSNAHVAERALNTTSEGERQTRIDALVAPRREMGALVDKGQMARATAEPSPEEQLAALTDTGATLAIPIFTEPGALLLLCHPGTAGLQMEVIDLTGVSVDTLNTELHSEDGWLTAYGSDDTRTIAIKRIGDRLWNLFAGPLVEALDARNVAPGSRLVLLPQGALGLLPLGLACDPQTGECLFERYELSLAPSLAALNSGGRDGIAPSLAAIVNPTRDLRFSLIEAALVEELFASDARSMVCGDEATVEAALEVLKAKSHWLFSCHGAFNWSDPRRSGLALAGGEALTLDALLSAQGLGNPRLVALSACETGLHDIQRSPEEFIGLPAAFLQLGATGVLATLWPVDDTSAALLVSRFFRHHIADGMRPAAALKTAQLWLRDLTVKHLRVFLKDASLSERSSATADLLLDLRRDFAVAHPAAKPFQHPYHWGGFALHGG